MATERRAPRTLLVAALCIRCHPPASEDWLRCLLSRPPNPRRAAGPWPLGRSRAPLAPKARVAAHLRVQRKYKKDGVTLPSSDAPSPEDLGDAIAASEIWDYIRAGAYGGAAGAAAGALFTRFGWYEVSGSIASALGGSVVATAAICGVVGVIMGVVWRGCHRYFFKPSQDSKWSGSAFPNQPTRREWTVSAGLTFRAAFERLDQKGQEACAERVCNRGAQMKMHLESCWQQDGGNNSIAIEDISRTKICAMADTFKALEREVPRDHLLAYHYTDQDAAELIASGQKGIKVSQSGSNGGGVFFSELNPISGFDEKDGRVFKEVWEEFRKAQLARNYGEDLFDIAGSSRSNKVDCVVVVKLPEFISKKLDSHEQDTLYVPRSVYPEYFPHQNIVKIYRLKPSREA